MTIMNINEFKALFEAQVKEGGETLSKNDFLSVLENGASVIVTHEGHTVMIIRFMDDILNKKTKSVQSSFMACEITDMGLCLIGVASIEATANSLKSNNIRFKNFRNLKFREVERSDAKIFEIANRFFVKFPGVNNLLGMAFNVRNKDGKILKKEIGVKDLSDFGYIK